MCAEIEAEVRRDWQQAYNDVAHENGNLRQRIESIYLLLAIARKFCPDLKTRERIDQILGCSK